MHTEIAQPLRFNIEATSPLRDQVHNYLRERQLLILLDNIEQIQGGSGGVRDFLTGAPQYRRLMTSRQVLGLRRELVREVTPLFLNESSALLIECTSTRGIEVDTTDASMRRLCKHLKVIPLALELAASRLGLLTLREVCDRLEDRFRLLRHRAPDRPARIQALTATLGEVAARHQEWPRAVRLFIGNATLLGRAGSAYLNYVTPLIEEVATRVDVPTLRWPNEVAEKSATEIAHWALADAGVLPAFG